MLPSPDIASVSHELIEASKAAPCESEIREADLYRPAVEQLQQKWKIRKQLQSFICKQTASQGRRDTGGSWSRPDIAGVGLRSFEFLPERVLEIYTFELKAEYDVTVKGVARSAFSS